MLAKDIKRNSIVNFNGVPCVIESISVQSPSARGASTFYKYRARNMLTKQKVDITLRGGESLDEADFQRRPIKYLYAAFRDEISRARLSRLAREWEANELLTEIPRRVTYALQALAFED